MTSAGVRLKFASIVCGALLIVLVMAAPAFAQSMIKEASYTNAIAYDLKSLQWTHFYGTFDRPVWAVLTVHYKSGQEVARIFDGPVPNANERFWFPSWNGKNHAGKLLPSSTGYVWKLRVVRGGVESVTTGAITISKVFFSVRGNFPNYAPAGGPSNQLWVDRYLVDGPAMFYIRATRPGEGETRLTVETPAARGSDWSVAWLRRTITAERPLIEQGGLQGDIPHRAVYPLVFHSPEPVWFEMTVLQ